MFNTMTNSTIESIEMQEKIDYSIAQRTMREIYGNMLTNMIKLEALSPADAAYTATTRGIDSHYLMEIKSVNNNHWQIQGEIFQFKKLFRFKDFAIERDNNERELIMFIMIPTNEIYIFDTEKINWEHTPVKDVKLKKTQYVSKSDKEEVKCFYLQPEDAVYHTSYKLTDEEKQMIDMKNRLLEMCR